MNLWHVIIIWRVLFLIIRTEDPLNNVIAFTASMDLVMANQSKVDLLPSEIYNLLKRLTEQSGKMTIVLISGFIGRIKYSLFPRGDSKTVQSTGKKKWPK